MEPREPSGALRAGGFEASVPASTWEWEASTVYKAVGNIKTIKSSANVTHKGRCHCGDVKFEVIAPSDLTVWDCNCARESLCQTYQALHSAEL